MDTKKKSVLLLYTLSNVTLFIWK